MSLLWVSVSALSDDDERAPASKKQQQQPCGGAPPPSRAPLLPLLLLRRRGRRLDLLRALLACCVLVVLARQLGLRPPRATAAAAPPPLPNNAQLPSLRQAADALQRTFAARLLVSSASISSSSVARDDATEPAPPAASLPLPLTFLPFSGASRLVIYVFADSDPEARNNLEYFIREGVNREGSSSADGNSGGTSFGDGGASPEPPAADYLILLQHDERGGPGGAPPLPPLPRNARYVWHTNACYDWGAVGWLLEQEQARAMLGRYRHVLLLNSSVRGPFMPAYLRGLMHWTAAFTGMLGDRVKIVGPSISCEGAGKTGSDGDGDGDGDGSNIAPTTTWTPHVQSYALAVDREGLALIAARSRAFACHAGRLAAIAAAEVGASAALLGAGAYGLDSFQLKYASTVDWRDPGAWGCNGRANPTSGRFAYDGDFLSPLEAMFVKVKAAQAAEPWVVAAKAYGRWRDGERGGDGSARNVSGNAVFEAAEEMAQHHLAAAIDALRADAGARDEGDGDGDTPAPAAARLRDGAPDDGRGLPIELAGLYAAYVGQFL